MSIIMTVTSTQAENNLPEGFFTPIVAFEFMQQASDVVKFFKVEQPDVYLSAMFLGNYLDYIFMLTYSLLLALVSFYFYKKTAQNIFLFAVILCPIILIGDALENLQIHFILKDYPNAFNNISNNLILLQIFTWIKWIALAIVFFILGRHISKQVARYFKMTSIMMLSLILGIVAFFARGVLLEVFALSIVLNFLLLGLLIIFNKKELAEI